MKKIALFLFLFVNSLALAENCVSERRIDLGSRNTERLQQCDLAEVRQVLEKEPKEHKHFLSNLRSLTPQSVHQEITRNSSSSSKPFYSKNAGYFSYESYYDSMHHGVLFSPGGHTVELEDGSIWRVAPNDVSYVCDWSPSHDLLVLPGSWNSSSPSFYFYNVQKRLSVTVTMKMGPFYDSLFARWIVKLDKSTGEVWLDDGSHFLVHTDDLALFNDWLCNDTIFVGSNSGFSSYSWPNILINVNTYNPLREDPNSWKNNSLYVQSRWIP